jgi:gliding motility-associated-like protein
MLHAAAVGQMTTTINTDATTLAKILTGNGVQVFNATYTGGRASAGTFTNANNKLLIDSGIILTNGFCRSGPGIGTDAPSTAQASNILNLPGDADIDRLIRNAVPTLDAVVLEFDFIPAGDTVNFQFAFASEEYPFYNCSPFSDIFAFFIQGPGYNRITNIALVPGTQIPVAINSINNGIAGAAGNMANCTAMGQGSPFRQYYIDNSNSQIVYNGMTTVLVAGARVQSCALYHMKLVITDLSDDLFDSGVFLKAGSFNSTFAKIEYTGTRTPSNEAVLTEGCDEAELKILYSKKVRVPENVAVIVSGTATSGDFSISLPDFVTIPANDSIARITLAPIQDLLPEGTERIKISVGPLTCFDPVITDSIEIRIAEYLPIPILPRQPVICQGNSIQLNISNSAFLNNFSWSPSSFLDNASIHNPVSTTPSSVLYTVTAESTATCRSRDSVLIKVKDSASIQVVKTDLGCQPNSGQIAVSPGYGWDLPQFSINGGASTSDSVFNHLPSGTFTIVVTDATGCRASRTITLLQQPPLNITNIIAENASCTGQGGSITIQASGGVAPYEYTIGNLPYQASNQFILAAGSYTIRIKDRAGCTASRSVTIASDPVIQFNYAVTGDSCRGLDDGTILITANGGSGNYTYSLDGTVFQASGLLKAAAGNYQVQVKDDKGCSSRQNIIVPLINTLFVQTGAGSSVCEGTAKQLEARSNGTVFNWLPAGGLSDPRVLQPLASPASTTVYTLQVRSGLCTASGNITLTVNPAPVPDAGIDTSICQDAAIGLKGSGGINYSWHPATAFTDATLKEPIVHPFTNTTYWLHVEDANGCRSILPDSVRIHVLPPVHANAGNDTIVAIGQPLQLNAGSNATVFRWQPATGLDDPTKKDPVAVLSNHITYYLSVQNDLGCSDEDTINIKVFKGNELYVPTAFTPNADGKNDYLVMVPAGITKVHFFRVYDRWGKLVFSTTDHRKGWDGKINGRDQDTGTYIWVAEGTDYLGAVVRRKGTCTLIR